MSKTKRQKHRVRSRSGSAREYPDITAAMVAMGVAYVEAELDDYLPAEWAPAEPFVVGLYRAMRSGAEARAVAPPGRRSAASWGSSSLIGWRSPAGRMKEGLKRLPNTPPETHEEMVRQRPREGIVKRRRRTVNPNDWADRCFRVWSKR